MMRVFTYAKIEKSLVDRLLSCAMRLLPHYRAKQVYSNFLSGSSPASSRGFS
jgi:hypothetical protein